MSRPLVVLVLAGSAAIGGIAACSEQAAEPEVPQPAAPVAPGAKEVEEIEEVEDEPEAAAELAAEDAATDAGAAEEDEPDLAAYDGPFIGALFGQTPIMSDMAWPKKEGKKAERDTEPTAMRIGYVRQGQKVPVLPQAHVKSNCTDGWYELVQGGFVCARYASLDLNHPKIKSAPRPPDMVGPLPYQYGYNLANGTPLYRTVPAREERLKLEPWLAPKPKQAKEVVAERAPSPGADDLDAGAPLTLAKATTITASTTDPFGLGAAEDLDAGTPWYLRKHDGGKPIITLDELKGEGPIDRRMVRGFFVGLDEQMTANGSKWWKTTMTKIAPFERIMVYQAWSKFRGFWFDESTNEARMASAAAEAAGIDAGAPPFDGERKPTPDLGKAGSAAQIGFILSTKGKKYVVSASRKAAIPSEPAPRYTIARLTGERAIVKGDRYYETDEGWWMRGRESTWTDPSPPPSDLAPNEKWIDISLSTQTLMAFEGDRPVFATLVSTGKEDKQNRAKHHPTPTGSFRVREKHIAATMDADVASESPYSIEDVPWIMYYSGGYAIHGAFWHDGFGRKRSHGCTNLAPVDARALFEWAGPHVPKGWHAVWSTPERPGTRIVVHD